MYQGITNKIFGPDSDKNNGNGTKTNFEFLPMPKSYSFNSILEEDDHVNGCGKDNMVDDQHQEVVGFGVVGYSSKSPRSGGENGEILQSKKL